MEERKKTPSKPMLIMFMHQMLRIPIGVGMPLDHSQSVREIGLYSALIQMAGQDRLPSGRGARKRREWRVRRDLKQ